MRTTGTPDGRRRAAATAAGGSTSSTDSDRTPGSPPTARIAEVSEDMESSGLCSAGGGAATKVPTPWRMSEQTLLGEPADRLPERGAADPQLLRERRLARETCSRDKAARLDLRPQRVAHARDEIFAGRPAGPQPRRKLGELQVTHQTACPCMNARHSAGEMRAPPAVSSKARLVRGSPEVVAVGHPAPDGTIMRVPRSGPAGRHEAVDGARAVRGGVRLGPRSLHMRSLDLVRHLTTDDHGPGALTSGPRRLGPSPAMPMAPGVLEPCATHSRAADQLRRLINAPLRTPIPVHASGAHQPEAGACGLDKARAPALGQPLDCNARLIRNSRGNGPGARRHRGSRRSDDASWRRARLPHLRPPRPFGCARARR